MGKNHPMEPTFKQKKKRIEIRLGVIVSQTDRDRNQRGQSYRPLFLNRGLKIYNYKKFNVE